jgi:catechol 2,3-dioxygenase-like lactoylglutathione lyase family enzyme
VARDDGRRSPDDGAPGPRPEYSPHYYGAFVRDPDGNSVEAVHHGEPQEGENRLDHLWIRVRDLVESRLFYETVAPGVGLRVHDGTANRFHVTNGRRSFALVLEDPVTENVHLAFPAPDRATVDAFHAAATEAGFRDNGAPGERPEYHAGYYGASEPCVGQVRDRIHSHACHIRPAGGCQPERDSCETPLGAPSASGRCG